MAIGKNHALSDFNNLKDEEYTVLRTIEEMCLFYGNVSIRLICAKTGLDACDVISGLEKKKLISYTNKNSIFQFTITNLGLDYLATKHLRNEDCFKYIHSKQYEQINCSFYLVANTFPICCLKLRKMSSPTQDIMWQYIMMKEITKTQYCIMDDLWKSGFPVPKPISYNRHAIIIEYMAGNPLATVEKFEKTRVEDLYRNLMELVGKLACHGLVHAGFNENNIFIRLVDEKPYLMEMSQIISLHDKDAEKYFTETVNSLVKFFLDRFDYQSEGIMPFPTYDYACKLNEAASFFKRGYKFCKAQNKFYIDAVCRAIVSAITAEGRKAVRVIREVRRGSKNKKTISLLAKRKRLISFSTIIRAPTPKYNAKYWNTLRKYNVNISRTRKNIKKFVAQRIDFVFKNIRLCGKP